MRFRIDRGDDRWPGDDVQLKDHVVFEHPDGSLETMEVSMMHWDTPFGRDETHKGPPDRIALRPVRAEG